MIFIIKSFCKKEYILSRKTSKSVFFFTNKPKCLLKKIKQCNRLS